MIEQSDIKVTSVYCFECERLTKDDACYCIAYIDINNQVGSFPNGTKKCISFCLTCWNLIAGKKYSFLP